MFRIVHGRCISCNESATGALNSRPFTTWLLLPQVYTKNGCCKRPKTTMEDLVKGARMFFSPSPVGRCACLRAYPLSFRACPLHDLFYLYSFFSLPLVVFAVVFSLSLSLPKRNGKSLRFIYSGTRFVPSFSFHLIFERCDFLDRSTFEKHDSRWSVNSSLPSLGEKRETEWKQYVSGWWIVVGSFQVSVSDKFDRESICIGRKIYFIYIIIILKIF